MTKYISIHEAFERNKTNEHFLIQKMSLVEEAPFFVNSFQFLNLENAVYYFFIKGDLNKSKNEFYKAAMANSYYHEKLGGEIFEALKTFTYPILSDNSSLINRYLSYNWTEYTDAFSTYFGKAIQSVLKEDNYSLQGNIEGLKKWSKKGWAKPYAGIVIVFEGFLNNNKDTIEKGLQEIIALHEQQEQPAIVKDYINLEATALAKLAYRKGIKVTIDSNLIPLNLLPIKELDHYEGYDFFSELKL